ncbi:MAG: hypothetical protein FJX76_00925 [Armatimonadetes bacterium]|nr:hypothetical protein [Armatimonadota bacterium]
MGKLATTAIGGLAALAGLLILREARRPRKREPDDEILYIHAEPRYDSPRPQAIPRNKMVVVPMKAFEDAQQ